jgi:hypothetical protein
MGSLPVYLGVKLHLGPNTRFLLLSVVGLLLWGAPSDERASLSFTMAPGPHQHSHSLIRVTVTDSILPQPGGPGSPVYIPKDQGDVSWAFEQITVRHFNI